MFRIDEEMVIHLTRGDTASFEISADTGEGSYVFVAGDVVRFKVFEKKDCDNVVLQKDFVADAGASSVTITLDKEDTKFGGYISKPTDYWYECELNPESQPQTFIGYDENGAKVLRLYPEGGEV